MALGGSYFKPRIDEILLHSVGEIYALSGNNFGCGRIMSRGFYTVCTVLDRGLRGLRTWRLTAGRG
jgi:hypothetical protein